MCDGIDKSIAMSIGEECDFDNIHALQLLWEADNLSISKDQVISQLGDILNRFENALKLVNLPEFATPDEIDFYNLWREDIQKACKKWKSEALELPFLEI